jgi:hypothetical protein
MFRIHFDFSTYLTDPDLNLDLGVYLYADPDQESKIGVDPCGRDPDPDQALQKHQEFIFTFCIKHTISYWVVDTCRYGTNGANEAFFFFLLSYSYCRTRSGFPIRIRIRESQISSDPLSGSMWIRIRNHSFVSSADNWANHALAHNFEETGRALQVQIVIFLNY